MHRPNRTNSRIFNFFFALYSSAKQGKTLKTGHFFDRTESEHPSFTTIFLLHNACQTIPQWVVRHPSFRFLLTAFSLTQSDILDHLQVNAASREEIASEITKLLAEVAALRDKEIALRKEDTTLLARLCEWNPNDMKKPVRLAFRTDGRTIRWAGGSVQLGKKPCKIVRALYRAKKHRLSTITLEKIVWGLHTPTSGNVRTTVCNLNKTLAAKNFPYEIVNIKCKKETIQIENPVTKKREERTIQPEISAYKLKKRIF